MIRKYLTDVTMKTVNIYRKNLMYDPERFQRCYDGKQEWICKTCGRYLKKKKRYLPGHKPIA